LLNCGQRFPRCRRFLAYLFERRPSNFFEFGCHTTIDCVLLSVEAFTTSALYGPRWPEALADDHHLCPNMFHFEKLCTKSQLFNLWGLLESSWTQLGQIGSHLRAIQGLFVAAFFLLCWFLMWPILKTCGRSHNLSNLGAFWFPLGAISDATWWRLARNDMCFCCFIDVCALGPRNTARLIRSPGNGV